MNLMFYGAIQQSNVSNWDTSQVTARPVCFTNPRLPPMSAIGTPVSRRFSYVSARPRANPDVSNWDTSQVTDMYAMFENATSANPDVGNWDT